MYEVTTATPEVSVRLAYKVNMGNYENLDIEFTVTAAAKPGETVDALAERVYGFTEKKLIEKVEQVRDQQTQ